MFSYQEFKIILPKTMTNALRKFIIREAYMLEVFHLLSSSEFLTMTYMRLTVFLVLFDEGVPSSWLSFLKHY